MLNVSEEYKEQINNGVRNRGHIRVTVGIVNNDAQKNATSRYADLAFFCPSSNADQAFNGNDDVKLYATDEENYTKVDGSMYFCHEAVAPNPMSFYYNGIVGAVLNTGTIRITLQNGVYDVKGLTINFGDSYPLVFTVQTNNTTKTYENNSPLFITEDLFEGVTYFLVSSVSMIGGEQRLRIITFSCGVVDVFSEEKVIDSNITDFSSPISDSVPSRDMTIKVNNIGQRFSPDNPNSLMAYMEYGQRVSIEFGYDLDEDGTDIEWLEPIGGFLSDWSADFMTATFIAKDIFDILSTSMYYGGEYYWSQTPEDSISLYDLAVDVLDDAGISEYDIDDSLRTIYVVNPMPVVSHAAALQIIANAGMCALMVRRDGYVQIKPTPPIPSITATSNNETAYSKVENTLIKGEKDAYANDALNFTNVDGSMYFATAEKFGGYYSSSVAGDDGEIVGHKLVLGADASVEDTSVILSNGIVSNHALSFGWTGDVPVITLMSTEQITIYGMTIRFRELFATMIITRIYDENDDLIDEFEYENNSLVFVENDTYENFSKIEIEFSEALSGSRIVVDDIIFDYSGYLVDKSKTSQVPVVKQETKIKEVRIIGQTYSGGDLVDDYAKGEIYINVHAGSYMYHAVYFNEPCTVSNVITTTSGITMSIIKQSSWFAKIRIAVTNESAYGRSADYKFVVIKLNHSDSEIAQKSLMPSYLKGNIITWSNPLLSGEAFTSYRTMAESIAEWIGNYYSDNHEYDVSWRGDPCIEVNDYVNVESTIGDSVLTRLFQNVLSYNGAWSGSFQARKVVRNGVDNS